MCSHKNNVDVEPVKQSAVSVAAPSGSAEASSTSKADTAVAERKKKASGKKALTIGTSSGTGVNL